MENDNILDIEQTEDIEVKKSRNILKVVGIVVLLALAIGALILAGLIGCTVYLNMQERDNYMDSDDKPVIYLYPEEKTEVEVELDYNGDLTCIYPKFNADSKWIITADTDGTLTDDKGQEYNYLYWEGIPDCDYTIDTGYCIPGEDTARFLELALEQLGLNRAEANEFIVYWLPRMESNPYNLISFDTYVYLDHVKLNINPEPDSILRVFMTFKAIDEYVDIAPDEIITPERNGFVVVEWGGTEIK